MFRLTEGGLDSIPDDWECLSTEQVAAEEQRLLAAEQRLLAAEQPGPAPPVQDVDDVQPDGPVDDQDVAVVDDDATGASFWEAETLVWRTRRCPEELWAVIPGFVPPGDEFEQRDLEARRGELRERARSTTYAVTLRGRLGEYNFARHRFQIEVAGLSGCAPGIRIALGRARVHTAVIPSRVGGGPLRQRQWRADPVQFSFPMEDDEAARSLGERTRGFLGRRIDVDLAFRVRRGRVDSRMGRGLTFDRQDIGAGALVNTEIIARRVRVGDELIWESTPE